MKYLLYSINKIEGEGRKIDNPPSEDLKLVFIIIIMWVYYLTFILTRFLKNGSFFKTA